MNDTLKSFTALNLKVRVFESRATMGEVAGRDVEEKILALLAQQEEIRMLFAAAPSQNELLVYLQKSTKIPWQRITAFHMDEYIGLEEDAPQRFANFLKTHLFDHVNLKAAHLLRGDQDASKECQRYTALVTESPIDIVCLGIGENGHIAFNDPPVADFDDPQTVKVVTLDHACRQQQVNDGCFASLASVPRKALTLTVPSLMRGRYLYCVVPGKTKQEAVHRTINQEVTTHCPATILKTHAHGKLYLDLESFGKKI